MALNNDKMLFDYLVAAVLSNGGELRLNEMALLAASSSKYKLSREVEPFSRSYILKVAEGSPRRLEIQEEDDTYEKQLLNG